MFGGFAMPSILPQMPPQAYKTYAIRGRRRPASCREVECERYERGWRTIIDESTDLGQRQAGYIRRMSGRRFRESTEGGLTYFDFYPEQQCFGEHFVSLEVDPRYLVLGGDFRGNPRGEAPVQHRNFDDWANDFGDHQDKLKKAQS